MCCADNERYFVTHVLAFFAGSDGIVMENLAARFMAGQRLCLCMHLDWTAADTLGDCTVRHAMPSKAIATLVDLAVT